MMEYNDGLGIELNKWVITTKSNNKFFNLKENMFVNELTENCSFDTPNEANSFLKKLDFGYIVKSARLYKDMENTRIRIV